MGQVATKFAAALLLNEGKVSLAEIRILPFVNDDAAVAEIVDELLKTYDASLETRREERRASDLRIGKNVVVLNAPPRRVELASVRSAQRARARDKRTLGARRESAPYRGAPRPAASNTPASDRAKVLTHRGNLVGKGSRAAV